MRNNKSVTSDWPTYQLHGANPCRKPGNSSAPQEIPRILRNPKIHYRDYKIRPRVPNLSHINPVHVLAKDTFTINFNIILPSKHRFPSCLFYLGFPTDTLYVPLLSPIHATRPAYLIDIYTTWILQVSRQAKAILKWAHSLCVRTETRILFPHFLLCHRYSLRVCVEYANKWTTASHSIRKETSLIEACAVRD